MWCYESAGFLQLTKASNCFRSFFVIGGFGCTSWIIALEGLDVDLLEKNTFVRKQVSLTPSPRRVFSSS